MHRFGAKQPLERLVATAMHEAAPEDATFMLPEARRVRADLGDADYSG